MKRGCRVVILAGAVLSLGSVSGLADDAPVHITLQHGRFDPLEVVVPANVATQLQVTNADASAIEFESFDLHRERVVQPGQTITVYLPALKPGRYPFFDDFHRETAQGVIVAQ